VVLLEDEFRSYLQRARTLNEEERLLLWSQLVEGPHKKLYGSFMPLEIPERQKRLNEQRQLWLKRYDELGPEMLERFPQMERDIPRYLEEFKSVFPALEDTFTIYVLPAMFFNGKTATVDQQQALLFGLDQIVERNDDLGLLFSHELFHIYHEQVAGVDELDDGEIFMTWPLWGEGMATYVSERFNPEAEIFMDQKLAEVNPDEIPWLAQRFLTVSHLSKQSEEAPEAYSTWFSSSHPSSVRPGLPPRLGYLLGYHVARELSRSYSLDTLARWTPSEAHQGVTFVLQRLADQVEPSP
jgi:hypothetical protein